MANRGYIIVILIAIATILFFTFVIIPSGIKYSDEGNARKAERNEYIGTVTAIKHQNNDITYIWLNSKPSKLLLDGYVELAIGEEYKIIVNGNDILINAILIGDN
jgi:uncharacterized protein YpmS